MTKRRPTTNPKTPNRRRIPEHGEIAPTITLNLVNGCVIVAGDAHYIRLTGNTYTINSTANTVPLANAFGENAASGATSLYIYNANTTAAQTLQLSNTQGSWTFAIPPNSVIILEKYAGDSVNSSSTFLTANPIERTSE